jgi:exodeoxyribonuclease V alpha subunit
LSNAFDHEDWVKRVVLAFDRFRILCAVHEGDWGTRSLNQSVQSALDLAGLLNPRGEWYAGRPVMVTRNDPALGVFNGDVGVTLPGPPGSTALRVYFLDGDKLRAVGVSRLAHVETAFAMTVHKSQGSEFLHTALVLPEGGGKVLTRELVYTGITRARESFTLIEAQPGLLRLAVDTLSKRASGLQILLADPLK